MSRDLAPWLLAALVAITIGLLFLCYRLISALERANTDARRGWRQAETEARSAREFRQRLEQHEQPPKLRVYQDAARARDRFDPPEAPTPATAPTPPRQGPVRRQEVTEPDRVQVEPPQPPIFEATTQELNLPETNGRVSPTSGPVGGRTRSSKGGAS